jgi:hypothetical protein
VFHRRTRVDLNEPHIKVRINHEIIAEHLMSIIAMHYHVSRRHNTPDYASLDLRLDLTCICARVELLVQISRELRTFPHVAFND